MRANCGEDSWMYGTVARMRLKPGLEAKLKDDMAQYDQLKIPGFVSTVVYRMDRDPNEIYMAVVFKDKASYTKNAAIPCRTGGTRRSARCSPRHQSGTSETASNTNGQ